MKKMLRSIVAIALTVIMTAGGMVDFANAYAAPAAQTPSVETVPHPLFGRSTEPTWGRSLFLSFNGRGFSMSIRAVVVDGNVVMIPLRATLQGMFGLIDASPRFSEANSFMLDRGLGALISDAESTAEFLGISHGDRVLNIFGNHYVLDSPVQFFNNAAANHTAVYVPLSWLIDVFGESSVEIRDYPANCPSNRRTNAAHRVINVVGDNADFMFIVNWLLDVTEFDRRANTALFEAFLEEFTLALVYGAESDLQRLEMVYDFIIENFSYVGQRDGATIDGSRRPNPAYVPRPDGIMVIDAFYRDGVRVSGPTFAVAAGTDSHLRRAWQMLYTGEGVCSCFAALFGSMTYILGFNVKISSGFYINRDGSVYGHTWNAIEFDDNWYFFDPQIETSTVTSNPEAQYRRHWWMQSVHGSLTQSRYDTYWSRYGVEK